MRYHFPLSALVLTTWAWLPSQHKSIKNWQPKGKIRGVNLGSMFIIEPWMAGHEWSKMGCASTGATSEFDCVLKLGQQVADSAFQAHWNRFITEQDIKEMESLRLNTVRIPVGYWIIESLVDSSEHFPKGGLQYLEKVCGWAANHGLYVIMDLHGAPFAQDAHQPFTGQNAATAGFYQSSQYARANKFLEKITQIIHTNNNYRTVGTIEVLNEPAKGHSTLVSEYYPTAYKAVRDAENRLHTPKEKQLHVQFMSKNWGAGNPQANLGPTESVWFDNHRYLKYNPNTTSSQSSYLSTSCHENAAASGEAHLVIGEWSLSPANENSPEFEIKTGKNHGFYKKWFAAQAMAYEKQAGWIFWSWKSELGDWRWSFRDAVEAGVVPRELEKVYETGAC